MWTNRIFKKVFESFECTQIEFAKKIQMNKTTNISLWLRSEQDLSPSKLFKILDALDINYEVKIKDFEG